MALIGVDGSLNTIHSFLFNQVCWILISNEFTIPVWPYQAILVISEALMNPESNSLSDCESTYCFPCKQFLFELVEVTFETLAA